MKKYIFYLLVIAAISSCTLNNNTKNNLSATGNPIFNPTDTSWKCFTVRQKIGQIMLMLPDRKKELELGHGSLDSFFCRYPVSGFFMGWKLYDGISNENRLEHIRKSCIEYEAASDFPLFFQEDYESGIGIHQMTSFPNEIALGAANSEELAFDYGKSIALESRSVGVNWVLHPVADLNLNPFNPITNVRSISDDPDKAIRLLSRQIRGLQQNGVAATIKHFPGDGVDYRDQHLLTTCNSLSMNEWNAKHGRVFKALIDSGVACIMPGHITLPAYQKEKINGLYPPATLSYELLTLLLKGELGFKGVIVSDAMVMGGFRGWYKTELESEIQSFLAGVDILLWPSYTFMDSLEARIIRGEIPIERLDDAVSRVWAMKERFGLLNKRKEIIRDISVKEKQFAYLTSKNICEKAITLVRDRDNALPINTKKDKKILVIGVTPLSRKGGNAHLLKLEEFAKTLGERGFDVTFQHNLLYETQEWTEDASTKYDKIVIALARVPHNPFGPLQLYDDEAQTAWAVNAMPKEKIIVVNFGNPYLVNEYFERVNACINAYSNTTPMHYAVISALLGDIPFKGISPVNLDFKFLIEGIASKNPTRQ